MTDPGTGGDDFAAVVAADLAARRDALDQLDELTFAADRAGVLILHADGHVEARAVLAGADGPTTHARALSRDTVARLAAQAPGRWSSVHVVRSAHPPVSPAAELLAGWQPAVSDDRQEGASWAALLITSAAPR